MGQLLLSFFLSWKKSFRLLFTPIPAICCFWPIDFFRLRVLFFRTKAWAIWIYIYIYLTNRNKSENSNMQPPPQTKCCHIRNLIQWVHSQIPHPGSIIYLYVFLGKKRPVITVGSDVPLVFGLSTWTSILNLFVHCYRAGGVYPTYDHYHVSKGGNYSSFPSNFF